MQLKYLSNVDCHAQLLLKTRNLAHAFCKKQHFFFEHARRNFYVCWGCSYKTSIFLQFYCRVFNSQEHEPLACLATFRFCTLPPQLPLMLLQLLRRRLCTWPHCLAVAVAFEVGSFWQICVTAGAIKESAEAASQISIVDRRSHLSHLPSSCFVFRISIFDYWWVTQNVVKHGKATGVGWTEWNGNGMWGIRVMRSTTINSAITKGESKDALTCFKRIGNETSLNELGNEFVEASSRNTTESMPCGKSFRSLRYFWNDSSI